MRQVGATLEGPAVVGKLCRVGPQVISGMGCFVLAKVRRMKEWYQPVPASHVEGE